MQRQTTDHRSRAIDERRRVVLVQDDERRTELVRRAFGRVPSVELAVFKRLHDAHGAIAAEPPDVVVVDVELPDGRGVELVRTGSYPLVVIVGDEEEAAVEDAMNAGAMDCVSRSETALEALPQIVGRALRKWNRIRAGDLAAKLIHAHFEVAAALATGGTIGQAGPAVLAAICSHIGWALGEIWRVDPRAETLRREAFWSADASTRRAACHFPDVASMSDRWLPITDGRVPSFPDLRELPQLDRRGLAHGTGLRSAFGFALTAGDRLLGVMTFFSRDIDPPDDNLRRLLEAISVELAIFVTLQEVEEDRLRMLDLLHDRKRLAAIGETAASFGHEIATPLNGLYMAGQLVQQRLEALPDMDPAVAANLARIVAETRRLAALLEDFRSRWRRL